MQRGVALAAVLVASVAHAIELGGRVEGGVALPLSQPQRSLLGVGFDARAVGYLELISLLDVELHVDELGVSALPNGVYRSPAGAFGVGAGLRLKRPVLDARIVPWLSADVGWALSVISNLSLSPTAGVGFVPVENLPLFVGVFVRVTQYFALGSKADRTSVPATFLSAGLVIELSSHSMQAPKPPPRREPEPSPPPPPPQPTPEPPKDSDGDGVPDPSDACPTVPGAPGSNGCPEYKQVVVTQTRIEIKQKIFFAFGTTSILPKSFPLLDEVTQALADRPSLCVRVEGHTDAKGGADANQKLSEGRAQSVREYLVKAGIGASRLGAKGYGATLPLDDNATVEGREKNRRVEFVIVPCDDISGKGSSR